MNRGLRQAWIDALRSGEYTQTIGELRRLEEGELHTNELGKHVERPAPPGYCCLGVLADLCAKQWPERFEWIEEGTILFPAVAADDDNAPYGKVHLLGHQQATEGELCAMGELLGVSAIETHLMTLNDSGESFITIADHIERNLTADDDPLLFLAGGADDNADQA